MCACVYAYAWTKAGCTGQPETVLTSPQRLCRRLLTPCLHCPALYCLVGYSGVLYVYLDRANNLESKAQQGFTRKM